MINVSLKDDAFLGVCSSGNGNLDICPKYINFDRENTHRTIIYTDRKIVENLVDNYEGHNNIAWLLESKAIIPDVYKSILRNSYKYTYVLTHDINLIKSLKNTYAKLCIVGGCWIREDDRKVYNKTKNLSIIASAKTITDGHILRHEIIKRDDNFIDSVYGGGYNPIDNKIVGLRDYRFSIVTENVINDDYFTEKLIDCFVTGTIPVYYGTKNISKYFNKNGIIFIDSVEDYLYKRCLINETYYKSVYNNILENFEIAKRYVNTEDWIYKNYRNIFL